MKKAISTIIITILCFSTVLPVLAQKRAILAAPNPISQRAQLFVSTAALSDGNGVWLEWQTGIESEILGFHVYRVAGGEKQLVSPVLIPGNYLPTGERAAPGRSYHYFDPQGDFNAAYVIEGVDAAGLKQASREFYPQFVADLTARAGASSQELQNRAAASNPSPQNDNLSLPRDLKAELETNNLAPGDAQATQKWVASQPGAKIVREGRRFLSRHSRRAAKRRI